MLHQHDNPHYHHHHDQAYLNARVLFPRLMWTAPRFPWARHSPTVSSLSCRIESSWCPFWWLYWWWWSLLIKDLMKNVLEMWETKFTDHGLANAHVHPCLNADSCKFPIKYSSASQLHVMRAFSLFALYNLLPSITSSTPNSGASCDKSARTTARPTTT